MKKIVKIIKEHKSKILKLFYITFFIIYVIKPIAFDVKLYLGEAYQADLIGSFPINLFETWEHKLILNRFIFYFLSQIIKILVNAENVIIFEMIVKFIYGVISILIIKIFSNQTKEFFKKYKISDKIVFFLLYLVLIVSRNIF